MKKLTILLALLALSSNAWATTPVSKQIDQINATGGAVIAVPTVGVNFLSDTNTATVSGKTLTNPTINAAALSGTITGAPTLSGALSLTGGPALSGSGTITSAFHLIDSTTASKVLAFSLSGMTSSTTLTLSSSQTTSQTLTIPNLSGADTMATLGATQTFGAGSTWNGAVIGPAFGGAATTINNSAATPQSIATAGTAVTLATPTFSNITFVKATSSGTLVITATPSVTACTVAGQTLTIVSESATNLITLQNQADLASSQLLLNGPWTSGMNNSTPYTLTLRCDGAATPNWIEISRSN